MSQSQPTPPERPRRRPWARFLDGLRLPFSLRRTLLSDPAARALYRRVTWVQAAITIALGVGIASALIVFVFWLAHQQGTRVVWSATGITIHSGDATEVPAGMTLDTGWKLAAGIAYVLFGTLTFAEGIVIALSREYHDQLGRRAAVLTQTEPEDPEVDTAGPPFFLRWAARVPVIKWYARLWHRLTRAVFAPCLRVEEAPWELSGLALARFFGTLPVLYLFFRPFLPVAAAAIITRSRTEHPALPT
jgi:hypothetical protein